jgi:rhodanese-related sulfurtransferase
MAKNTAASIEPERVWDLLQQGRAELFDLRTEKERRRYGAPPGAEPTSLMRAVMSPEGKHAIYLCQHALRSKLALRNGAAEVAGGFEAWVDDGLPVEPLREE